MMKVLNVSTILEFSEDKNMTNKNEELSREIYISGEINNEMATEIITHLKKINDEDLDVYEKNQTLNEKNQLPYKPISLTINSPGGSVMDGCAIMNTLDSCIAPVHTHGIGEVSSMAVHIYACGEVRTAGDLVTFGLHGTGGGTCGYTKEMISSLTHWKRLEKKLNDRLLEDTKLTQKDLDDCETCLVFYDYDEALEKGLINTDLYDEEFLKGIIDGLSEGDKKETKEKDTEVKED